MTFKEQHSELIKELESFIDEQLIAHNIDHVVSQDETDNSVDFSIIVNGVSLQISLIDLEG